MPREIITFQFGNYSNFIGAHYWNIQSSQFVYSADSGVRVPDVDHDVLFREGLDHMNRVTFTPRMLLFDFKDNVNVFQVAEKSNSSDPDKQWSGTMEKFESEKTERSQFSIDLEKNELEEIEHAKLKNNKRQIRNYLRDDYAMNDEVKYWSDFLKLKYNDKSYMLMNDFARAHEDSEPFDLYQCGVAFTKENHFLDDFEERLRKFSEECDQIQGFQFFVDSFNGFGGMATQCRDILLEEYSKKSIFSVLAFPYFENQNKEAEMKRLINTSFTMKNLMQDEKNMLLLPISTLNSFFMSDQIKPVKLDSVEYKANLNYHTSAILASLIDSASLPWRQKSQRTSLNDIVNFFDIFPHKIVGLQSVYPINLENYKYLFNYLQEIDLCSKSTWFTPLCNNEDSNKNYSDLDSLFSVTSKGIEDECVKNPKDTLVFKGATTPANCVLDRYFSDMYPKSRNLCFNSKNGLDASLPFPDIFKNRSKTSKKSIPMITMLEMNKAVHGLTSFMHKKLDKLNINKHAKYFETGMETEDFDELKFFMQNISESFST